jgi:four helix bundle protein
MNDETPTKRAIIDHKELRVYQLAFDAAMTIFDLTTNFPAEERYALSDQIRRSSRSICANLAEAWRKRRYEAAFLGKLSDCEAEAAETQTWLDFAINCQYISPEKGEQLYMTDLQLRDIIFHLGEYQDIAFPVRTRYIINVEKLNQQRFNCATQV